MRANGDNDDQAEAPEWLVDLREAARRGADGVEMPTLKTKGWEFTDLSGFDGDAYVPTYENSTPLPDDETRLPGEPAHGVIIKAEGASLTAVDGIVEEVYDGETTGLTVLALPEATHAREDIVSAHLGSLVRDRDVFAAENTAGFLDGAFVHVAENVVVEHPVVITSTQATPRSRNRWRSLIVVEAGAEVTIVEQYLSAEEQLDAYFNPVTEIIVGEGAHVNYLCVQDLSESTWLFGNQRAVVGEDADLHWVSLGLGGRSGKLRMETDLGGRGASARVTGAYVARGQQHVDYETTQEHFAENTTSDLSFRGTVRDNASVVWSGMIRVDEGAKKTDAFQESRNLLLSAGAHVDAIPGLEIEANDVRCTHAATVGRVDEEQLFYLQSRGLSRAAAEELIIEGFLGAVAERIHDMESLRRPVTLALKQRSEQGTGNNQITS